MMSDESDPDEIPALDEHDAAAVFGLLIRIMRIDDDNKKDREALAEINARITARGVPRVKYLNGLSAFGFSTGAPDLWDKVKTAIGRDTYARAWRIATEEQKPPEKAGDDVNATVTAEEKRTPDIRAEGADRPADTPKISQIIIEYLRALPAGQGANVAQIKKHLADAFQIETHEKTPGMTLYRLSKDGLVRRDGRLWFANEAAKSEIAQQNTATDQ